MPRERRARRRRSYRRRAFLTSQWDASTAADLARYPIMRALLRARASGGPGAAVGEIQQVVDDIEGRFGRDGVAILVGSLALGVLESLERDYSPHGLSTDRALDGEEQRALQLLDDKRRGD